MHNRFGLIGKKLSHSFSPDYFRKKFSNLQLTDHSYEAFELPNSSALKDFLITNSSRLKGVNVTIPYKEIILPFLDEISEDVKEIGAVNTIRFQDDLSYGFNTDHIGFANSLKPLLQQHHRKALILGTGGASKAVQYALKQLQIEFLVVSRSASDQSISYQDLNATFFKEHTIIINTTPLGTFPDIFNFPDLPYEHFSRQHIAYDLVYNPSETAFLKKAKANHAITKNGYEMLIEQAEASWNIWTQ